jgi:hypothetical protein
VTITGSSTRITSSVPWSCKTSWWSHPWGLLLVPFLPWSHLCWRPVYFCSNLSTGCSPGLTQAVVSLLPSVSGKKLLYFSHVGLPIYRIRIPHFHVITSPQQLLEKEYIGSTLFCFLALQVCEWVYPVGMSTSHWDWEIITIGNILLQLFIPRFSQV